MSFTHFDEGGRAVMVDVTDKAVTRRQATARCSVTAIAGLADIDRDVLVREVLPEARAAAMLAAKGTSSLIPLCHPLPLDKTEVEFEIHEDAVTILVTTHTVSETGVEMEALAGAAFGALSVFHSLSLTHRELEVAALELLEKRGGRSGTWRRTSQSPNAANQ